MTVSLSIHIIYRTILQVNSHPSYFTNRQHFKFTNLKVMSSLLLKRQHYKLPNLSQKSFFSIRLEMSSFLLYPTVCLVYKANRYKLVSRDFCLVTRDVGFQPVQNKNILVAWSAICTGAQDLLASFFQRLYCTVLKKKTLQ